MVPQESKSERAAVAVTPRDKRVLQELRDRLETTESELLYEHAMHELSAMHRRYFPESDLWRSEKVQATE